MTHSKVTLTNSFLRARFDARTGNLLALGRPRIPRSDIGLVYYQYVFDGKWFAENPQVSKYATRPDEDVSVRTTENVVESTLRTPHIAATRRFELPPNATLLKVTYIIRGMGPEIKLTQSAFPYVTFPEDFNDVTEDEQDLHFDGAELGGNRELPCWRVLFRKGHRDGLIVAARSKLQMSHVQIERRAFRLFPHISSSYSSDYDLVRSPMIVSKEKRYEAQFEMGPWQRNNHSTILRRAKLNDATVAGRDRWARRGRTDFGAPGGRALPAKGEVFRAVGLVPRSTVAKGFHRSKWLIVRAQGPGSPSVLLANAGCCPPAIVFKPKFRGVYRIFADTGGGAVLSLRLPDEPFPLFRSEAVLPFHSLLADQPMKDLDFGVAEIDGRPLRFETTRHRYWPSRIDYIRFEKLSPAEVIKWRQRRTMPPCTTLAGFADTYDIAFAYCDSEQPMPETFRANIWAHQRAGFRKIYWRIHGECADFPTKIGTMRPMIGRAHDVFEPQAKAYSLALRRFDLLRVALEAAREFGIELYGWIRFNAYMSETRPEFFEKHLDEFADECDLGDRWDFKMCFAIKRVRDYIIAILVEAASCGLNGLSLGFLRHAPILMYHRFMVEAYKRKFGKLPPRDWKNPDCAGTHTLPKTTPEYVRWYQFRAIYMTQFGRELRAALQAKGLTKTKVSIWVRPNQCLFDGIDIEAWVNEGLCDEVVADIYVETAPKFSEPTPEWKRMVQSKVPLLRGVGFDLKYARANARRFLREGYDGISTYESNGAVDHPGFLALYESLRMRPEKQDRHTAYQ
ncbi:MAG: hypothetical protein HY360_19540 [Verrucomicrobia bacterium]|nr:hypothetical protein [Verrucomicrobiota bacterium]